MPERVRHLEVAHLAGRDPGIVRVEGGDERGEEGAEGRARRRRHEFLDAAGPQGVRGVVERERLRHEATGRRDERPAGRGQHEPAALGLEERQAQLAL